MTRLRERRGENAKNRRNGELEQVSISRKPLNRNDFCTKKLPNQEIMYVTVDKFTEDHLCFYLNFVIPSIYIWSPLYIWKSGSGPLILTLSKKWVWHSAIDYDLFLMPYTQWMSVFSQKIETKITQSQNQQREHEGGVAEHPLLWSVLLLDNILTRSIKVSYTMWAKLLKSIWIWLNGRQHYDIQNAEY